MSTSRDPAVREDWAALITEKLEWLVGLIRDHSVRPAAKAVRIAVVAVIGLLVSLIVLGGLAIGVVRLFDHDVFRGRVWATSFLFGGILLGVGSVLLRASVKARSGDA
jgi:hypothetical protein